MRIAFYYGLVAILLAFICWQLSFWPVKLLAGWAALSLLLVASAYGMNTATIFRKRSDGSMPWYSRWLFTPFLFGAGIYNVLARRLDKVPPIQKVSPGLYLGARLTTADIDALQQQQITAVLDVTAEFTALDAVSQHDSINYLNIPVLDHACPTPQQLQQAIQWLAQQAAGQRKVLVHCALGRGRSVLVLAAFLFSHHKAGSADKALTLIKQVRHTARLNKRQLAALHRFVVSFSESAPPVWLIVNPVAGGGKWLEAEAEITGLLSPAMPLTVHTSSANCSAKQLAEQAKAAGCKLVIACGGDGTITEVASVLTGTDIRLGIIPLGTTNALSHALWGVSAKLMPVQSACQQILAGHCQAIDTARCNGRLLLLLAGIGFEQQMIANADRDSKNELGQLAYLNGLWRAVQANNIQQLWVSFDQQPEQALDTASLVVANAAPLTTLLAQGRGAPDITDGKLDITWLNPGADDSSALPGLAELALAGLTSLSLNVSSQHCRASQISIRPRQPQQLQYVIDGELYSDPALEISIVPASLNVMLLQDNNNAEPT